jgi:2,5-diamino-6-(ribosylamino)-4(3H)-pyrimidinone 5'-phosphate reductase
MLPRVIVHNEMSLDARLDGLDVDMGRFYAIAGTWHEDCTLVGSETLLAAMPELGEAGQALAVARADGTGQEASRDAPLLAAVDSRGRLPGLGRLRDQPHWRDAIALCSEATPMAHLGLLDAAGVSRIVVGAGRVDLRGALEALAVRYGVGIVRVDAGGSLVGALMRQGLVHEVSVLIEPRLVGGMSHHWLATAPGTDSQQVVALRLREMERFDDDAVWLRYDVV